MSEIELYFFYVKIGYWSLFCRIVLMVVLSYKFIKTKQKPLFYLLIYAAVAVSIALFELAVVELSTRENALILKLLTRWKIDSTFFTSPFIYINSIYFHCLFYSYLFKKRRIFYLGLFLVFVEIVNTIFFEDFRQPQQFGMMLYSITNLLLAGSYIRYLYLHKVNHNLVQKPYFIISMANAIPMIFSVLLYFLTRHLFEEETITFYKLSIFRLIVDSFCYLLMAYGASKVRK